MIMVDADDAWKITAAKGKALFINTPAIVH
jgi:hypothetical protein